jgi:hypothetical protein
MTWSPELETLDQLLGGDMPLAVVRKLFPTADSFVRGVTGLLSGGDVRLVDCDGQELPRWRWREVLDETSAISTGVRLGLTEQGARKIG